MTNIRSHSHNTSSDVNLEPIVLPLCSKTISEDTSCLFFMMHSHLKKNVCRDV